MKSEDTFNLAQHCFEKHADWHVAVLDNDQALLCVNCRWIIQKQISGEWQVRQTL